MRRAMSVAITDSSTGVMPDDSGAFVPPRCSLPRSTSFGGDPRGLRPDQEVRRLHGRLQRVLRRSNEGEILGLIGPNGSGKSTIFNCIAGMLAPTAGSVKLAGEEIAGLPAYNVCHKGIGRTYQIPRPFRNLTLLENVALSAWFGQQGKNRPRVLLAPGRRGAGPRRPAERHGDHHRWAGRRGAEEARARARARHATEAPAGGRESQRPRPLGDGPGRRHAGACTQGEGHHIVWVEHIMGVLMRVVDRVVVLDHGEKIFDGAPQAAQSDPRVVEVYLGADAA